MMCSMCVLFLLGFDLNSEIFELLNDLCVNVWIWFLGSLIGGSLGVMLSWL